MKGDNFWPGWRTAINASLNAGCRFYFASPTPFQSLLLNEGAKLYPQFNGVFTQAETPDSALSMALGVSATGNRVMVSCNLQGFLAMQETLGYFVTYKLPVVIILFADGSPANQSFSSHYSHLRYFINPNITSGFPIISILPYSNQHLYQSTISAFKLSETYNQPVILLIDPIVFHTFSPVIIPDKKPDIPFQRLKTLTDNDAFIDENSPTTIDQIAEIYEKIRITEQKFFLKGKMKSKKLIISPGSTGYQISKILPDDWSLFIPETISPFPLTELLEWQAGMKNENQILWVENHDTHFGQALKRHYNELTFKCLAIKNIELSKDEILHQILAVSETI